MKEETLAPLVYVDEETGEKIEVSPPADITLAGLMTYAVAKTRMDAKRLALAERMMELQKGDPQASALAAEIDEAQATVAEVEAGLEGAFSSDLRRKLPDGISFDFGFALITWPKPSATWEMKVKAAEIQNRYPEMAQLLGVRQKIGNPSAPRVTIRAEKLAGVGR